jgi:hypothetical protein
MDKDDWGYVFALERGREGGREGGRSGPKRSRDEYAYKEKG